MEHDLISRSAVLDRLEMLRWNYGLKAGYRDAMTDAIGEVSNALTVDAVPVVHEHWIDACRGKACICSRCGEEFDHTCNAIKDEWLFCPKCGAKMDAEEDTNGHQND